MAGKSTFIKSVGAALFLAHLGMGVPADKMKVSLFDGILSNINVVDNLVKGESYFFNEVQRIRNTIIQISDKRETSLPKLGIIRLCIPGRWRPVGGASRGHSRNNNPPAQPHKLDELDKTGECGKLA
jgi:hypothetical protein